MVSPFFKHPHHPQAEKLHCISEKQVRCEKIMPEAEKTFSFHKGD